MQQGVEFTVHKDDPVKYGNIKKVYSMWICTETSQARANSIEKYNIDRSFIIGENSDAPRYDILTAVIVNISAKHDTGGIDNTLIKMLTDLFDERLSGAAKVKKLQNTYNIPMTRETEKEVPEVCTYAEAMVLKGLRQGIEQGIEQERKNSEIAIAEKDKEILRLRAEINAIKKQ